MNSIGGSAILSPTKALSAAASHEPVFDTWRTGMAAFLVSEVAFFSTLIVAYLTYMGKSLTGPKPEDVLGFGIVVPGTLCLLASSVTVHYSTAALEKGAHGVFRLLWASTIILGILFLVGTAVEWKGFIVDHGLTIRTNLFGTTYYTLVGFHAFHVTIGVLMLSVVFGLALNSQIPGGRPAGVELISWYWHFVDVVWVVVFTVVYLIGR